MTKQHYPSDIIAERGALGCVLSSNGEADSLLDKLNESLFFSDHLRDVFRAALACQNDFEPVNELTVINRLRANGDLERVGGPDFVATLASDAIPALFDTYFAIARDKAARRKALADLDAARRRLMDETTALIDAKPPRQARAIGSLIAPDANDGKELLKHRYLCRGAGLLLVGPSGQGKSSLIMQMLVLWSIGRACFDLTPTAPLKSLIIQAENDDGDLHEMYHGVCRGLDLTAEENLKSDSNIVVYTEDSLSGPDFMRLAEELAGQHKPDIIVIDPALAFIAGDSKDAEMVGAFLRRGFNPILHRHNCAGIVVHHTAKGQGQRGDGPSTTADFLYAGAGSSEWTNWPRASLVLETKGNGVFTLHAPKRGSRIRWPEMKIHRYIQHSRKPGALCWEDAPEPVEEPTSGKGGKKASDKSKWDVLALVPEDGEPIVKEIFIERIMALGVGDNRARRLAKVLIDGGDLHQWKQKRIGTNPLLSVSRKPQIVIPI